MRSHVTDMPDVRHKIISQYIYKEKLREINESYIWWHRDKYYFITPAHLVKCANNKISSLIKT